MRVTSFRDAFYDTLWSTIDLMEGAPNLVSAHWSIDYNASCGMNYQFSGYARPNKRASFGREVNPLSGKSTAIDDSVTSLVLLNFEDNACIGAYSGPTASLAEIERSLGIRREAGLELLSIRTDVHEMADDSIISRSTRFIFVGLASADLAPSLIKSRLAATTRSFFHKDWHRDRTAIISGADAGQARSDLVDRL